MNQIWTIQTKKICKFSGPLGETMHRTLHKIIIQQFIFLHANIKFQNGKDIKKNRDQPQKHFCFKIKIDLYFVAYIKY